MKCAPPHTQNRSYSVPLEKNSKKKMKKNAIFEQTCFLVGKRLQARPLKLKWLRLGSFLGLGLEFYLSINTRNNYIVKDVCSFVHETYSLVGRKSHLKSSCFFLKPLSEIAFEESLVPPSQKGPKVKVVSWLAMLQLGHLIGSL